MIDQRINDVITKAGIKNPSLKFEWVPRDKKWYLLIGAVGNRTITFKESTIEECVQKAESSIGRINQSIIEVRTRKGRNKDGGNRPTE